MPCHTLDHWHAGFAGLSQQQRAVAAMQLDYKLSDALAGWHSSCVPCAACSPSYQMVKSPCKWCMALPAKPGFMFAAVATAVGPFQYPDLRPDLQVRSPTSSVLAAALARLRAPTQQRPSSRLQCTGDTARAIG